MSKGAGQRPELIHRPSDGCMASTALGHRWHCIKATHWCKQTMQNISKQRVAFMVHHFLSSSLGLPQICYPCLTVLKVEIKSKHVSFNSIFFFFFLNFVAALAVQLSMSPFLMKCVKCLGLNYCLAKCFCMKWSLYDLPYWEGIQGETLHVCNLHTYVNK